MKRIRQLFRVGRRVCITALFTIGMLAIQAQTPSDKQFRAGAATSNVTPFIGDVIVGGFGVPRSTHIHDELHARCLVLDDGERRLVFAIVDNVGIPREVFDEAKRLINEFSGIPMEQMLMSSTHTHSGTSAGGEGEKRRGYNYGKPLDQYQSFLARRIADGIRVAMNNLEPARIGWGAGKVPQHLFNRRWKMKEPVVNPFGEKDLVKMNPGVAHPDLVEQAGPTDPEVSFISVESVSGKPIALLANYSLHYVGGVKSNDISADYFSEFADRIQELLNADRQDPPFVGIMSNGTSGDVNNINFRGPSEKHAPYEKMRIVADDVAKEVFRVYKTIKHHDWVRLQAAQSELKLNVRKPTPKMLTNAEASLRKPEGAELVHSLEKIYANRILQVQREWPDQISIILQTFRIGDLGLTAIPFETFTETGLELKRKSPLKQTFNISIANGSYGYLPTPEQHKLGGYETWLSTNRVETDASRKIVEELLRLFSQMK